MESTLSRKEAIQYLKIPEKHFDNYFKSSQEISAFKKKNRWYFKKAELDRWKNIRTERSVRLSLKEYEQCFEFAIKMAYSSKASHGTGIRGTRSEVQVADDFILGILAEHGLKKFLKKKYNALIQLDTVVHPDHITPQDVDKVKEKGAWRDPKICVAVKSSKTKSCYNIIPPIEYENDNRKSDVYIFVRVGLPSDHLFRILREHSFFKNVKNFLKLDPRFRKIEELNEIMIWICGFNYHSELDKVKKIPGQEFDGYRYVKSVKNMGNSKSDWEKFIKKL